jgi:hypothetical protein
MAQTDKADWLKESCSAITNYSSIKWQEFSVPHQLMFALLLIRPFSRWSPNVMKETI